MRAFLYAGAASLLLSLWVVEDRSTAQLMEAFYLKLAQGCRKASALRHVQMQFINGQFADAQSAQEGYAHPYFWAPFFLVGEGGPL
jgi:CHAT domain-containing protein